MLMSMADESGVRGHWPGVAVGARAEEEIKMNFLHVNKKKSSDCVDGLRQAKD